MKNNLIINELLESKKILNQFIKEEKQIKQIQSASTMICKCFSQGGKVISCGNGGSHCDAMHFAEELTGKYRNKRPGYPAIAISDPSYISSVSNDFGYKYIFSRFIQSIGNKNDVLMAISTSGNSENIIHAIKTAKLKNMKIITLNGKTGGKIIGQSDIEICIPHLKYADRIQEMHIKIIHILIFLIEIEMKKISKTNKTKLFV